MHIQQKQYIISKVWPRRSVNIRFLFTLICSPPKFCLCNKTIPLLFMLVQLLLLLCLSAVAGKYSNWVIKFQTEKLSAIKANLHC